MTVKLVLNLSLHLIKMKSKQIYFVSADWTMTDKLDQTTKWMDGRVKVLPHYLNKGRIDEKS